MTQSDKNPHYQNWKGKWELHNEVQIYTHCLACYSMSVDAEAEGAEAPIFMCKRFTWCQYLHSEYQFEHLKWGTKANWRVVPEVIVLRILEKETNLKSVSKVTVSVCDLKVTVEMVDSEIQSVLFICKTSCVHK